MRADTLLLHARLTELSGELQNKALRSTDERAARYRSALRKVDAAVRALAALDRDVWEVWGGPESQLTAVPVADGRFDRSSSLKDRRDHSADMSFHVSSSNGSAA